MIPVKILAVRYLPGADPGLAAALGAPEGYPSLGMLTTDCDDATYIALDAATKAAEVEVCYARSFYAGASNASTPNAGEVIGILAGVSPGAVRSGMEAALAVLSRLGFEESNGVPYLAHTVSAVGSFLAGEAGVPRGSAVAYLIAPPPEQILLKAEKTSETGPTTPIAPSASTPRNRPTMMLSIRMPSVAVSAVRMETRTKER